MGTKDPKYRSLRRFNAVMAVVHLLQGALMVYLSSAQKWTITATRLGFDMETETLEPVMEPLFDVQLSYLVAAFLLLSALAHFLISTVLYDSYVKYLKQGMNPYRWYEYSISASVMIVVIAMLSGIWDIGTLIALFGLTSVMNLLGLVMELHNQTTERTNWTSYIVGTVSGIVPWIIIGLTLFFTFDAAGASPPDFVIAIFVSIFILFNTFAINMILQYREVWKWEDYLFGERVYIVLSLVAKSLLAWQIYFGTLNAPV